MREDSHSREEEQPGGRPITLKDAYAVLGVRPGASVDEIRSAYRRQLSIHHPDAGGDADALMEINWAFAVLHRALNVAR